MYTHTHNANTHSQGNQLDSAPTTSNQSLFTGNSTCGKANLGVWQENTVLDVKSGEIKARTRKHTRC